MNRDRVAKLLRFTTSHAEDPDAPASLDEYIQRAPAEPKVIYYLGGPNLSAIKKSPNYEVFRRRGLEVIFLNDPVDEFVFSALGSYDGRKLVSIDVADVELPPETAAEESKPEEANPHQEAGFERSVDAFPRGARRPREGRPGVEATDGQPLLSGQCRRRLQHADAADLEDE